MIFNIIYDGEVVVSFSSESDAYAFLNKNEVYSTFMYVEEVFL